MIVRIFKTNQVYIFAFIPLVVLALRWPTLFGEAPFNPSGQLPFLTDFFAWLSRHAWLSLLLTTAAITFQGFWVSWTANEHRLFPYISNLPSFILVICYSVLTPLSWFSPVIFANIFLVLALKRIADSYQKGEIKTHLFRAGVYIALASILYLPSMYMLLILFYGLAIFRPFKWREYVMPVAGILAVYFWLFSYYFLREETDIFFNYFIEPKTFLMIFAWKLANWLPAIVMGLLIVASMVYLITSGSKRNVRENNLYKVISAMFAVSVALCLIFIRDLVSISALLWPSLSILLTHYLLNIGRNWIREGMVYILIVSIVLRAVFFLFETPFIQF